MTILEEVTKLRNQGFGNSEIKEKLRQNGIPPKQINDSLDQLKIKDIISKPGEDINQPQIPHPKIPELPITPTEENQQVESNEQYYSPQPPIEEQYNRPPQNQEESAYPPQEQGGYYSPQPSAEKQYNYPPQNQDESAYSPEQYDSGYNYDSNSIIDLSEQVFAEKIKDFQKELNASKEFRTIAQIKIENISERLKKIEGTIDKLQLSILHKIGSYGENLENIKKEMSMIENSFKKMTGNIADKISKKTSVHLKRKRSRK